jgi:hypothetical protein
MTGEVALKSIGLEVQGMIQDSIKNGNWEKNASSTIKAKKGQGQELIETGSMLLGESYAASHRPSSLAAATSRSPDGMIRFSANKRAICSLFLFDHRLLARLGVNL